MSSREKEISLQVGSPSGLETLIEKFTAGLRHEGLERENSAPQNRVRATAGMELPPLLVDDFRRGMEEVSRNCDCGCGGPGEQHQAHDCHARQSGNGCGGCHHHG
ncbi:MAG: hypothetical protein GXO34_00390 [Deltaproteobacteria bacterium]|nr:hypothetical protein [Deltaproteobacteria bacterium]